MLHGSGAGESGSRQSSAESISDRSEIRDLLENWVIWRDAGDWERFATVWHEDGRMVATWFRASAADFIAGCRKGFEAGMVGLHSLGGTSIDVQGTRAVAQSKMQIVQRGTFDELEVDVTCLGRFVDALEKRDGRWGMVLRQPVYELDRMTPVDPAAKFTLDAELLASFPRGYQHLGYLQTKLGVTVDRNLPGTRGPEIEALCARMKLWLGGASNDCLAS
ncbi:nuclear transport factor 2 family protein [Sphingomonas sp. RT2P30]|uniref:nuclear transport factor 2 family protein n=1 Tax=Parasphingomonas halimpatiens TaxID=3096162 RepID=UPI002FC5DB72